MLFRASTLRWLPLAIMVTPPAVLMMPQTQLHAQVTIRIATYNASLFGKQAGEIRQRLLDGNDRQAEKVAAIVQTIRPDVLLINEIDYDADGETANLLAEKYFAKAQGDRDPIEYPWIFAVPSNTGIDSGLDLNRSGRGGEPHDAWGYGLYPGQYSMAVYSRFPINQENIRTFQQFRWKEMPGALRPIDPKTNQFYYDDSTWNALRLSSKNHVDIPFSIGQQTLHLAVSHPTPPVFDGDEDRNGCRNHDEIRFWNDYLSGPTSTHLVDDQGNQGGLPSNALIVIAGDLNADPSDGDGQRQAIRTLLDHPRLQDPNPASEGAVESKIDGDDAGDPRNDTASFGRNVNMRVDYVLPCRSLVLKAAGVFWPVRSDPDQPLISASDHRMVWIEVEIP